MFKFINRLILEFYSLKSVWPPCGYRGVYLHTTQAWAIESLKTTREKNRNIFITRH